MTEFSDLRDVDLMKMFIALRDSRATRKTAYQADDEDDRARQDMIETEFLRRFNDRGIDNVSARDVGTAYKSIRNSATVSDWDKLLTYTVEHEAWELLEQRVNKFAVEQYYFEHGEYPPGVNWSEIEVVNFRRT